MLSAGARRQVKTLVHGLGSACIILFFVAACGIRGWFSSAVSSCFSELAVFQVVHILKFSDIGQAAGTSLAENSRMHS